MKKVWLTFNIMQYRITYCIEIGYSVCIYIYVCIMLYIL